MITKQYRISKGKCSKIQEVDKENEMLDNTSHEELILLESPLQPSQEVRSRW